MKNSWPVLGVSLCGFFSVLLGGCASLIPAVPGATVDAQIPGTLPYAETDAATAPFYWQSIVTDPILEDLVERSLQTNRDLRVAAANVAIAQANLRLSEAQLFPVIGMFGSAQFGDAVDGNAAVGNSAFFDSSSLGLGASSWELDLFNKLSSGSLSAQQAYFASAQGERSAKIALVSGVISTYLQLAADKELLKLSELSAESQKTTLDLVRQYREMGTGSELEVRQASAILQSRNAQAAQYRAAVQRDLNALRLLVGSELPADLVRHAELTPFPVETALEVNADSNLLLTRPDILSAEYLLRSTQADIHAARATYFPSITLSASGGFVSGALSDLFTGAGATGWAFTPSINLPIFDGGRRDANFDRTVAARDQAIAAYEGAIQTAFREASDALANSEFAEDQLNSLEGYAEDSAFALDFAEDRYRAGVDSYLTVLDAQRQDYSAQQQVIFARLEKGQNAVALFKALGDWPD